MSALLTAVEEARRVRVSAEREFRSALVRAKEHHSLSEIARAAGLTRQGIAYLLKRGASK